MAESRRYDLGAQLDIKQILLEAQHRWLRPAEICEILRNYKKFRISPEPANRPPSPRFAFGFINGVGYGGWINGVGLSIETQLFSASSISLGLVMVMDAGLLEEVEDLGFLLCSIVGGGGGNGEPLGVAYLRFAVAEKEKME